MNTLNTAANVGSRARRMGALLLITLALMASFFGGTHVASGTRHRAGNGPGNNVYSPPPSANFGGFPYGSVYLNGIPVTDAVVAMGYDGREITTAVVSLPQFKDPLFMFDSRPARELSTTFGATAIFTATIPGHAPVTTTARLFPDQAGEVAVPLWIGEKPDIKPVPTPAALLSADAITNIVAAHQLDAGGYHTCMVVAGRLRCWGHNDYWQVGVGGRTYADYVQGAPVEVPGITQTVRAVAAGVEHTCVVLLSGRVQCFGHRWLYGATGTADPGALTITSTPIDVPGVENAVDIVAGEYVTCVLVREVLNDEQSDKRRVKCWGMNNWGQLGIGTADLDPHPTATYVLDADGKPLENVTSISVKGWHVCAVVAGGVKCWGLLLNPDFSARISPVPINIIPAGSGITYVEAGHHYSCAIQVGGAVFCWGYMLDSGLGPVYSPTVVPALSNITKLAIGRYNACAVHATGIVLCWGEGDGEQQVYGMLGPGATQPVTLPTQIAGITNAVDITIGEYHVCVLLSDAGAKCWGTNASGQLGDGTSPNYPYEWYTPVTVTAISESAASIATGEYHTCAIAGGVVRCWGANGYGQLGGGYTSHLSLAAITVTNLPPNVTMVSAGRQHTCALTAEGAVYCWGRNDYGQLGDGSNTHRSLPMPVWGLDSGIKAIAAGEHHTCALRTSGVLLCWGLNGNGQLAKPSASNYAIPVTVTGLAGKVSTFGLGDLHTCAVTEVGVTQCWGDNSWGKLGNGTYDASFEPVTVTGLYTGVSAISPARDHTCAIVNSGVKCWGWGDADQLANTRPVTAGSPYSESVPVDVVGLSAAVVDLDASENSTCALLATGEALCWGAGYARQIGIAVRLGSATPVTVTALGNSVTQIKVSSGHWCARLADGSLRCWGDNMYGQVGNGYSLVRDEPVDVVDIPPAKWTYMLYLAGDNDLSFYLDNVADALNRLPQSPDLNIAVFFDGQGKDDSYIWSTRDGTFNKWRIEEAESRTSDAATLAQFIDWAHANFPAEHYYLSIADHGRGTTGIAFDTQNGTLEKPEALTPAGLRQALVAATNNGLWQIDVLHFDACLMALLEVANQVKDYAHYMIASENLTVALYPYDKYAQAVLDNPAITPRDLALEIADEYYYAPYMLLNNYPRTISVLDLSQSGGVVTALDTLAGVLTSNMGAVKAEIAAARDLVQVFDASPDFTSTGTNEKPTYYSLTRTDEYVDLRHLAQLLRSNPNAAVSGAALALYDLLDQSAANGFVVRSRSQSGVDRLVSGNNWDLANSHGVAIYFPLAQNPADYPSYVNGGLFTFTAASQWDEFLKAYLSGTDTTPLPDPGIPPVIQPMVPITTHCEGSQSCLWGTVYGDGLPLAGAAVTLAHANGVVESTSAVVAQNEFEPIFRFPLGTLNVQPGDRLTLTAVYSTTEVQRSLIFDPVNGEQEAPMLLQTTAAITDPTQMPVPVAAGVRWAIVYPQTADGGPVSFTAEGATSDGSPIVAYRWTSNLDGDLGTSSSFNISSDRLRRGVHVIEVTAISNQGVESPPATMVLTVTAPAPARMELAPGQTVVPVGGEEVAIDVRVFDRQNIPVEDGTLVRATTTLGELVNPAAATKDGTATFFLRSPNHPGSAVISLFAGEAKVETGITFIPAAAAQLVVQPSTPRLPSDGIATAFVSAIVADRFGNRVPNLAVSFVTDLGTIEPLVVTDALGQARATYTTTTSVGVATITATAGDLTAKTQIAVGGAYSLMLPMIARGE